MMPHAHAFDNLSLRFWVKGGQLNHGESRSLDQNIQWNLQFPSHWFWVYGCVLRVCYDDSDVDDVRGDEADDNCIGDRDYSSRAT